LYVDRIKEGDIVILMDDEGRKLRVRAEKVTKKVKGLGVANLGKLLEASFGDRVTVAAKEFTVLRPSIVDSIETMERRAQIIVPKDAAYILLHCDIGSGSLVVEAGSGSGALTTVLAWAVAPNGKVVSYDNREEHQAVARRNIERAGLSGLVEWKMGDLTEGIVETGVDAFVLDIGNPWDGVDTAAKALRKGGHLATFSPTANQVETTVKAMRERGFVGIQASELIHREMVVIDGGIRPSFDMRGHSGYICIARWLG
jgi:tRNA (adenine57-N1/adenine58-N1)-methyltransferase